MKVKTINISMPEKLLENIDRKAKDEYRSRSELIREAALYYLQTKNNWAVLEQDLSTKAKKLGIKNEDDVEEMVDSLRS